MPKAMPQITCTDVASRAFEKWTTRGQPPGTHLQDWQQAEADLRQLQLIAQQLADLEMRLAETLTEQAQARRYAGAGRCPGFVMDRQGELFSEERLLRVVRDCQHHTLQDFPLWL